MKRGRISWFAKLAGSQQRAVLEAIDAEAQSAQEIYNSLNLRRFCCSRSFRDFVRRRRRDRLARSGGGREAADPKRVTLDDVEQSLLVRVKEGLDAGRAHGSELRECRLLLTEIRNLRAEQAGKGTAA